MTTQGQLFKESPIEKALAYPTFRYMGSKHRLLPWIYEVLKELSFETVLDGFSGSGAVSYLLKSMGKQVTGNDFLHFSYTINKALIENNSSRLTPSDINNILSKNSTSESFITDTFSGIFFTKKDLEFLDSAYWNIENLIPVLKRELALTSLIRACIKKQPRGVFTVSGDLSNYDDGRRDLRLSLEEHFLNQVELFNTIIFDNGKKNISLNSDIFSVPNSTKFDLVYLDPPYVPRSDDNCYVKRYHFLEGLSKYWKNEEIMQETKVKKIKKKYTPFSYKKSAEEAFSKMFDKFKESTIVLSYSSNGYPDLKKLVSILKSCKQEVEVFQKDHKYHFGTHSTAKRSDVKEYLIIGY
jgi:adenine-specific DNA-methyltransferase